MNKRIISLCLAIALLLCLLPQTAIPASAETNSGTCGENLTWSFAPDTGTLTIEGSGAMKGYGYNTHAPWEDYRESIQTVLLPEGLTSIGAYAFYGCTALTSVTIPDSVTSIDAYAFRNCTSLTSVSIGNRVTSIGEGAFFYCENLISATVPDSVTTIGTYAFYCCENYEPHLPSGLRYLGYDAFWDTAYKNNPTYFEENNVIYLDNWIIGLGDQKDEREDPWLPSHLQIRDGTIGISRFGVRGDNPSNDGGSQTLPEVTIPASVRYINDDAFRQLGVERVNIHDLRAWCSIEFGNIDANPLCWHSDLYLDGELVEKIEFQGDSSISNYSLYGCRSIREIITVGGNLTIGECALANNQALETITVENGDLFVGSRALEDNQALTAIKVENGNISLSDYALYQCKNLEDFTVGGGLSEIGPCALYCCEKIREVTICEGIEAIGRDAFQGCDQLQRVNIPSVESWCNIVFENESANPLYVAKADLYLDGKLLEDIIVPDGITAIHDYAFVQYQSLRSIWMPESVASIGYNAFNWCNHLKAITIMNRECQIYEDPNDSWSDTLYLHGGLGSMVIYGYSESTVAAVCEAHEDFEQYGTGYYSFFPIDRFESIDIVQMPTIEVWEEVDQSTMEYHGGDYDGINWIYYDYMPYKITAKTRDGQEFSGPVDVVFGKITGGDEDYNIQNLMMDAVGVWDDQFTDDGEPGNKWNYGNHAATLEFLGRFYDFNVNVKPCPVDHIEAENVKIEEGTHLKYYQKYDYQTGKMVDDYEHPYYNVAEVVKVKVAFKDGTSITGNADEILEQTQHAFEVETDEDWDNRWAPGVHNATVTYAGSWRFEGFSTTIEVEITPKTNDNPFKDVDEKAFYYDAVLWAYNHNPQITAGTNKTHFSPYKTCTREQVVTFLWRAKGCVEPTSTNNPFKDVPADAYYTKAVLWAVENGITNGKSRTKFGVGDPCTRGQVVTFLWRAEGEPEPTSAVNPFKDVSETDYFYKAVLWAVENGITKGTSKTKFSPTNTCTRGQVVTFLYRDLVGAE